MKIAATAIVAFLLPAAAHAAQTVDAAHKHAWAENIGWLNWRDAGPDGVRKHPTFFSGYAWSENTGWISLGDGQPQGSLGGAYTNAGGDDYGVNILAGGGLAGFAWGENIGWINFATPSLGADRARYDGEARRLRGYAWGENVGWINLDDASAYVAFVTCPADLTGDGLVNSADLPILLGDWGANPASPADFNGDGRVDADDLAQMLGAWGVCP